MQAIEAADPASARPTGARVWAGRVVTTLVVLFLIFDGTTKIVEVAPVIEASAKVGLAKHLLPGIGLLLLVCTAVYAIPRTAALGALLLTAYLGGATAIHVRAGSGAFETLFAVGFGGLVWLGLALREPRLARMILTRE